MEESTEGGAARSMRTVRRWEQGEFSAPRPLVFKGWPGSAERPSSFRFEPSHFAGVTPGGRLQSARIFYRLGWTAVIFWNRDIYFADETLTFDGMIELLRSRFPDVFYLRAPVEREYVD